MKNGQLYLSRLFANKNYNDINDLEIIINKIEILKEKMTLVVYLQSPSIINEIITNKIYKIFKDKFIDFEVVINFKYNIIGSMEENISLYEDKFFKIIKSESQFRDSWIESLKWEIRDDSLVIYPPNEVACYSLNTNKAIEKIKDIILQEMGLEIDIEFSDSFKTTYIVFDIETTGLSPKNDMITEIGAIKIKDGKIIDIYSQLINPGIAIPEFITNITGITDDMVRNKPTIKEVIFDFARFIEDGTLVAHNASFDVGFIREKMKLVNMEVSNPVLDTLELSRTLFPSLKSHKLNIVAKHLNVSLDNHHRAVDDATATAEIFLKILDILKKKHSKA